MALALAPTLALPLELAPALVLSLALVPNAPGDADAVTDAMVVVVVVVQSLISSREGEEDVLEAAARIFLSGLIATESQKVLPALVSSPWSWRYPMWVHILAAWSTEK